MEPDTFEGRRLLVRALGEGDRAALTEAVESTRPLLRRRLSWAASAAGPDDELSFIRGSAAAAAKGEEVAWGIFDAKGERLAGVAALKRILPERNQAAFGIWVRADRQDKGYATEAGRLILEQAFRKLGLHRVYARIDPTNRGFRKVLKKLGFRYEGCLRADKRLNGRWIDQECWGLLKPEWKR